jgi:hypothetical protein
MYLGGEGPRMHVLLPNSHESYLLVRGIRFASNSIFRLKLAAL